MKVTKSGDADRGDVRPSTAAATSSVAVFLGIPLATIYRWRSRGDGPRGIRVGRHVRYRVEEVERWLDEN